jgi:hypothetical protein
MDKQQHVDIQFRNETEALRPDPVRWDHVERRVRRKQRRSMLMLIGLALGLTILLATILFIGKTAVDPTFSPPIFSRDAVSGAIPTPRLGRDLVARNGQDIGPQNGGAHASAVEGLGYVLTATVKLTNLENNVLVPRWHLRQSGAPASTETISGNSFLPRTESDTVRVRTWVPAPQRTGRYVAELDLLSQTGGTAGRLKSDAFSVVGLDWGKAYATPSYAARLPRGWRLESDYELASPERYVSRAIGPYGMSVVIDTTLHTHGRPIDDERSLENLLSQSGERYRRIALNHFTTHGDAVIEWSYWSGQHIYTDELFYRGANGYGVLGESSAKHFRETRDFARAIVRSISTPTREGARVTG